jgi:hypothetical protein
MLRMSNTKMDIKTSATATVITNPFVVAMFPPRLTVPAGTGSPRRIWEKLGDRRDVPRFFRPNRESRFQKVFITVTRAAVIRMCSVLEGMGRFVRVVAVDAPHHITQRGNARPVIHRDNEDRATSLALLRKYCERHGPGVRSTEKDNTWGWANGSCLCCVRQKIGERPVCPQVSCLSRHRHRLSRPWNARDWNEGWGYQNRIVDPEAFASWFYHDSCSGIPSLT